MCKRGLASGVDEEVGGRERDQRAREAPPVLRRVAGDRADSVKFLGGEADGLVGVDGVLKVAVAGEEG